MKRSGRRRPCLTRTRTLLVLATALSLGSLTAASASASVQPAPHAGAPHAASAARPAFSALPASSAPTAAALQRHDYRRACAAARAGRMACLALIRTGMRHQLQPAARPNAAPVGFGYGPPSLQSAYALPSATVGSGQTVAIVDAFNDPNAASDLATYRSSWGLPACGAGCFSVVNQNGQASPLPGGAAGTGWDVEESLDVDMVSAICPLCHIVLVEANSASFSDLGTAVNAAVGVGAKFVSNSYGATDSASDPGFDASFYNHPGVAVTASAGDGGFGVEYPAASQFVTAVGGTTLTTAPNARGWAESVWGSSAGGEGTGSGCSSFEAKPAWQIDGGCSHRTNTDVSADANPNTGVAVYDTYTQGGWLEVGGTSASSPMVAATFALAGTPSPNTYPSSYIYKNTLSLFDVTSGANGTCSPVYLCTGEPGYDGPTGFGTPDGITAFSATAPPPLGYVKTSATGSGTVEVHVDTLGGGSYHRTLPTTSDFAPADATSGKFSLFGNAAGEPELGYVKTASTGSGKVEVHLDAFSGGSYHRVLDTTSDFTPADAATGTFQLFGNVNGEPELGYIKTSGTGSGTVEVHVDAFSGGSYRRVFDTTSDFTPADAPNGSFELFGSANGQPELGYLKTAHSSSGTVEVHVDTLAGAYHRVFDTTSDFSLTDGANGTFSLFGNVNGQPELGYVKTVSAGSGTVEVHADTFSGSAYHRVLDTTSDFGLSNAASGIFGLVPAS